MANDVPQELRDQYPEPGRVFTLVPGYRGVWSVSNPGDPSGIYGYWYDGSEWSRPGLWSTLPGGNGAPTPLSGGGTGSGGNAGLSNPDIISNIANPQTPSATQRGPEWDWAGPYADFYDQPLRFGQYGNLLQQALSAGLLGSNMPTTGPYGRYAAAQAVNPNYYHGGTTDYVGLSGQGVGGNPGGGGGGVGGGGGGSGGGGSGGGTGGVGGADQIGHRADGTGTIGWGRHGSGTTGSTLLGNPGFNPIGSGFGGNFGGTTGGELQTASAQSVGNGPGLLDTAQPSAQPQGLAYPNAQAVAPNTSGGFQRNADGSITMRDPGNPWSNQNITIPAWQARLMPESYWQQQSQGSGQRLDAALAQGNNPQALVGLLSGRTPTGQQQAGQGWLMLNPQIQGLLGGNGWRTNFNNTSMNTPNR